MAFATDKSRWQAVTRREPRADGAFFYAVTTTGVYCRPTCPSRLPNRTNVVFFSGCADAERAGFRACKRCKPRSARTRSPAHAAIVRACKMIDAADEPLGLHELARTVGLSPFYFHRLFKEIVGVTPKGYAAAQRMQRMRDKLPEAGSVTRAIYDAGFGSSSRFYERAGDMLGMTPSHYKTGAAGLRIRFAIANSYLGSVLVAATERGICTIEFGDTPEALRARLAARFPRASLVDDDPDFASWIEEVLALMENPSRDFDLPLDIQGTAFQQRVWRALRAIPPGSTATYGAIARRIGRPSATRAVAHACASNAIAVAIPCHRVVGGDGNLKGYRWGIERKRALLDREAGCNVR
jgi:AraC family transcriptional regulator of adaptative response/methylated-DNA-[protein]-cysteine methyltransferase